MIASLLSIFAVHCTKLPLRILNVQLQSKSEFSVWTGSSQERDLVCVPNTAAKFVYQITINGTRNEVSECLSHGHPLTFVVGYRLLETGKMQEDRANVRNRNNSEERFNETYQ